MKTIKKTRTILRILRGRPRTRASSVRGRQSGFSARSGPAAGWASPLAILIVIVLIVAGGAGYYFYKTSSAEKYSSPEKTYSLFIKATEERDTDAYLECFTVESQKTLGNEATTRFILEILKTDVLNIRNLQSYKEGIKVIEKTDDRAVMGSDIDNAGVLVFKKEEGNWKIDLEETLEPPRQKARDARRIADIRQIQMALELYFSQHAAYPVLTDTSEDGVFLKILVDEGYFAEMLLDPQHPEHYYEYNGNRESYVLKGYIEEEGGIIDMKDGIKDHAYTIIFPK